MTNNKVTINYKGQSVDCYDTLTEESNFQIACSDRLDAEFIDNWKSVVKKKKEDKDGEDKDVSSGFNYSLIFNKN